MGKQPSTDLAFRLFCAAGRGWVFGKANQRLHKADCALLPWAYATDKLLWEWEGEAQVLAYLNRYRQGWALCPHCCWLVDDTRQQEKPPKTPRTSAPPSELPRAYRTFHLVETASLDIAEAAYRTVMKVAHPDKGGTEAQAREATHAIETIRTHWQQRQQQQYF